MLLTSGQVSVAVSSGIVFAFTGALFLSGYVLQQQTVRGLQAAIKPRLPTLTIAQAPTGRPITFGDARKQRVFSDPEDERTLGFDEDMAAEMRKMVTDESDGTAIMINDIGGIGSLNAKIEDDEEEEEEDEGLYTVMSEQDKEYYAEALRRRETADEI